MRWYLHSRKISGVIDKQKTDRQELSLMSQIEGRFLIMNTEESRGIEKYPGQELLIEGRVKSTSEGTRYLWVDRWWRPDNDQSIVKQKIS